MSSAERKHAKASRGKKRKRERPGKPTQRYVRQARPERAKPYEDGQDDNLFNRTSDRVHGYSSKLSRYLRLSISLRTSVGYSMLLLRMIIPLALLLCGVYGYLQAPKYITLQREAVELLPTPELPGVEVVMMEPIDTLEDMESVISPRDRQWSTHSIVVHENWGIYWDTSPLRIRLQYLEPYGTQTAQILFSLEEDWRILRALLASLLCMLLFAAFNFLTRGKKLNGKLLRPITDITETAQKMGEKNLSARINVAGTQNELRDLAVIINDMLDRIEAAYNRQKQFVSDASHELRTPIAVIQGYAGLLERWGKDNPEVRDEAIAAITGETQSMKELVENLLFLARHDKKTLSLNFAPFDSAEMLYELGKETEIIATDHRVVMGEIARCTLIADRSSVKQAVRVFVDNAIKYTPPGGSVTVSSDVLGGALCITVSDSGPGIKKADLARIFDRFYRADEARNGQSGGHGLGLAIARIIALSHGGKIHVRSQLGMGSAFILELPITRGEQ